jgi:hypothetical protein
MSMPVSEKNFLEKLASHIPGIAGYREREARRDTDRRLREFLAARLEEGRAALNSARDAATSSGDMAALQAIGRIDRTVQRSVAALRYANTGYSGAFDQLKIREGELEAIYAYDVALTTDVVALQERLGAAGAGIPAATTLGELATAAEGIDAKIARRREVLEKPTDV